LSWAKLVASKASCEFFIPIPDSDIDLRHGLAFSIMSDKETQPRRVIVDDRRTGEGFDVSRLSRLLLMI
jgi:hypothetical protein